MQIIDSLMDVSKNNGYKFKHNIPNKIQLTVFGYIKENRDKNSLNIPTEIIDIIIIFYYHSITLKFNTKKYGNDLVFINEDKNVKIIEAS